MHYTVAKYPALPAPEAGPAEKAWANAAVAKIDHFHDKSSEHRPAVRFRALHDGTALGVLFEVADRYVRCVHTNLHDPVCRDSCVEFFVEPIPGKGYFNFEFNCGGTMLVYFIEDPTRPDRHADMKKRTALAESQASQVTIATSLPQTVEPEITEPIDWWLAARIPVELLEEYLGPLGSLGGQSWRGNFYKCGDQTSHPHWASWSPVTGNLNFHKPECFGELHLDA